MKLLVVEDDKNLRDLIKNFLENDRYLVDTANDGKEALSCIKMNDYDCVLLDLNLPALDGIKVAQKVRDARMDVPIIMVTARSEIYNKLEGFETGADDYLTKPFHMKELLARVNALIKRSSENKENILMFNDFVVYNQNNKLLKEDGTEIFLSNKEMGILEYLLRNKGRVVSSEELLEHVWDRETDIFSDTVKTHMKTLRKKIDPDKLFIKTIRGKGYIYS